MVTAATVAEDAKVIAAWGAYLEATKDVHPVAYREVEEWAWVRLQQRLRVLDLQSR